MTSARATGAEAGDQGGGCSPTSKMGGKPDASTGPPELHGSPHTETPAHTAILAAAMAWHRARHTLRGKPLGSDPGSAARAKVNFPAPQFSYL